MTFLYIHVPGDLPFWIGGVAEPVTLLSVNRSGSACLPVGIDPDDAISRGHSGGQQKPKFASSRN